MRGRRVVWQFQRKGQPPNRRPVEQRALPGVPIVLAVVWSEVSIQQSRLVQATESFQKKGSSSRSYNKQSVQVLTMDTKLTLCTGLSSDFGTRWSDNLLVLFHRLVWQAIPHLSLSLWNYSWVEEAVLQLRIGFPPSRTPDIYL